MSLAFLFYFQNDGSTPVVDTPTGGHFLPVYEFKSKPKTKQKKRLRKKQPEVIHRVTSEQLTKLSEAISDKIPDRTGEIEEVRQILRREIRANKIFANLKTVSEHITQDMLMMAQIEQVARKIKADLLRAAEEEQIQMLFMQLIIDDII